MAPPNELLGSNRFWRRLQITAAATATDIVANPPTATPAYRCVITSIALNGASTAATSVILRNKTTTANIAIKLWIAANTVNSITYNGCLPMASGEGLTLETLAGLAGGGVDCTVEGFYAPDTQGYADRYTGVAP